ncbi:protein FAM136A isoform 2, partial [Daubentonia madagascariensis]
GGAAAGAGAGGRGLHGEESGEREHPQDAGSGAGAEPDPSLSRCAVPGTAPPSPQTRSGRPRGGPAPSEVRLALVRSLGSCGRWGKSVRPGRAQGRFHPVQPGGGGPGAGDRGPGVRPPASPHARPLPQGLMFRCSASCCEDSQASMQQVHQCIERCHVPLAQAQALVTNELEKFQDRLARCTMHCNDKAKDSIDAGSKELQVKRQLDSCVTKCVDDHMHLIPTMTKKMKESLISIGK